MRKNKNKQQRNKTKSLQSLKMTKRKEKKGRKRLLKGRIEALSVPPSLSHSPTVKKKPDNLSTVLDAKVTVTANFDVKVPDPVGKNS